jgi:predicted RNA-binding Zn-ribbon protein involved in translation (DUF1610 family)
MINIIEAGQNAIHGKGVTDLISQLMDGRIDEVRPVIDITRESGVSYPQVEPILGKTSEEAVPILDSLVNEGIFESRYYDRLIFCPVCNSMNLRPSIRCPKCASGNISRGRIIEHMVCGRNGLEEDFIQGGKYICPQCNKALKFLGTDYRSLGVNYKCRSCGVLSNDIGLKWQCLKCSVFFPDEEAKIHNVSSYVLNELSRSRIAFDMGFKTRLIEFLKLQGYEIFEMARITSQAGSGAAHVMDILARRDDGFLEFVIGVGVAFAREAEDVGLEEVFRFDNKVYDLGIHDKVMLAMPALNGEARQFARRQRIKAFDARDLAELLDGMKSLAPHPVTCVPFEFKNRAQFLEYLHKQGYRTEESARIPGRSGAEYTIDIVAYFDDGLFTHTISVGILSASGSVGLEAVSAYDTKAYDIGIHDKVLLVSPALSQEARLFAGQQKIKVIEVADTEALA